MPFKQMENISMFLTALEKVGGFKPYDLFSTVDLYEEKNMKLVKRTILSFKAICDRKGLKVKLMSTTASKNVENFNSASEMIEKINKTQEKDLLKDKEVEEERKEEERKEGDSSLKRDEAESSEVGIEICKTELDEFQTNNGSLNEKDDVIEKRIDQTSEEEVKKEIIGDQASEEELKKEIIGDQASEEELKKEIIGDQASEDGNLVIENKSKIVDDDDKEGTELKIENKDFQDEFDENKDGGDQNDI
jgi:hypothetical protein